MATARLSPTSSRDTRNARSCRCAGEARAKLVRPEHGGDDAFRMFHLFHLERMLPTLGWSQGRTR